MKRKNQEIEVHSEEVQDIIGRNPSWIVTYGNVVIGSIIILLLIFAYYVRYPDIIQAQVTISSSNPPIRLVAPSSGMISEFSVGNGDYVSENQIIATIDNSANTNDVIWLKNVVNRLDSSLNLRDAVMGLSKLKNIQVGDIQASYAALFQAVENFKFLLGNKFYSDKKSLISKQRGFEEQITNTIGSREDLLSKQLNIEAWKDSVNQLLVSKRIISSSEYKEIRKSFLSQNLNKYDNLASKLANKVQLKEYQKSIADLDQQNRVDENQSVLVIKEAVQKIKSQISIWEKQHVFRSPVAGKLVFFKISKVNQYVNSGAPVFVIVPKMLQYEVRAELPIYKSGKVQPGQKVLIKLKEYPYEEFGMLKASVNTITSVSLDSAYSVNINLKNGLTTTLNKKIGRKPVILGVADIITSNRSIFERIFSFFYKTAN